MRINFLCLVVLVGCAETPPSKTANVGTGGKDLLLQPGLTADDIYCKQGWTEENRALCEQRYGELKRQAEANASLELERQRNGFLKEWEAREGNKRCLALAAAPTDENKTARLECARAAAQYVDEQFQSLKSCDVKR